MAYYHAVVFAAIANFVKISLRASVARSPIATTFSCSELAAAGYCSLAQEHEKRADRPPAWVGLDLVWVIHLRKAAPCCLCCDWWIVSSKAGLFLIWDSAQSPQTENKAASPVLEIARVLVRFDHVAR